mmetsp:Transcript_44972/g.104005  ORF Transcript_44972/g.104005 Transcript_44972/m.104005 type:complete len:244 (+) Transcript_44972:281-1012(+)
MHIAQGQALACEVAPSAGSSETHDPPRLTAPDRLVANAINVVTTSIHFELNGLAQRPSRLADPQQRVTADEVALVELHETVESRLKCVMVLCDVLPKQPHALLDAERIHRSASPISQLWVSSLQSLVEPGNLGALHVQLQTMLADEGHPNCDGLHTAERQIPPLEGLEHVAGQIHRLIQQLLHGRLCVGAVDEQHSSLTGDVLDVNLLTLLQVLAHPPQIVELVIRIACDVEVLLRKPHECEL